MRILHLRASAGAYGAERVVETLAREQRARGLRAEVLCLEPPGATGFSRSLAAAGVPVHRIEDRGALRPGALLGALSLVRRLRPDVLHSHGYKTDALAALLSPLRRRPRLVATSHGWTAETRAVRLYERLDRTALRTLDAVVAVSAGLRSELIARGVPPGRVALIPNGVAALRRARGGPALAAELGLPPGTPLVGFVGRLAPEKNVGALLEAAASGLLPDVHLAIAGDGPVRGDVEAAVARLGLGGRAHLLGRRDDARDFLPELDALVLSSTREGMPLVLLEAMDAGVAVVATAVGGVPDVVQHERTGLLVAPGDPGSLARALRRVVDDRALRGRLGEAARAAVRARFSASVMAERYLETYAAVGCAAPAPAAAPGGAR